MKTRAAGLLVLAAVAFGISHYLSAQYPWLEWVQAFSEAAMVGGLADWFAVTALFRHPLGIPIPHTAIIPARKDRVGQVLGAFVERIVDVLKMIIDIDPARPTVEVWFRGLTTSFIETIGGIDFHGLENLFGIGISQGPFLFDTTSLYGNDLDLSSDDEGEKEQDEKRPQGSTGKCTSYIFLLCRGHRNLYYLNFI